MIYAGNSVTLTRLTSENKEHFSGYFDKCPWNASGAYVLTHEVGFAHRPPGAGDEAVLGVVETARPGAVQPLARTRAWNWQQGAMLQWWGGSPEDTILFNDRREGRFVSVLHHIHSGRERVLPLPVAAVSRDGRWAVSLNFSRLADERPGYGYAGLLDPFRDDPEPEDDGLFLLDMMTGDTRRILSTAEIAHTGRVVSMEGAKHRFNHVLFSPDGRRFIFLHRWRPRGNPGHLTRMYTVNRDGTDLYCLNDHEMTSHFDWRGNSHVLAFARRKGIGDRYFLFTDRSERVEEVGGEELNRFYDGHCSVSPAQRWMLTDSYPDKDGMGHLFIYHLERGQVVDLGAFHSPFWNITMKNAECRCDFHPRWSADGKTICFDSTHEGHRQVYVMDIQTLLGMQALND